MKDDAADERAEASKRLGLSRELQQATILQFGELF
jgi:hypothetical protein